jgi:hypothetical protein
MSVSVGTTADGKPVQAGDQVTVMGKVSSVSLPNITIALLASGNSITAYSSNFNGPTVSGAAKLVAGPNVGDAVSGRAAVNSVSGSGSTASLTVQFGETTQTVQARDCYASQSL